MKRCKHRNFTYIELIQGSTSWCVQNGQLDDEGYHSPGDMMEPVRVICQDCGFDRSYRTRKQQPAWVRAIGREINERCGLVDPDKTHA